jgi:hypothetical protein
MPIAATKIAFARRKSNDAVNILLKVAYFDCKFQKIFFEIFLLYVWVAIWLHIFAFRLSLAV